MEPHESKQLALQKAISAHEQASASLVDLMSGATEGPYAPQLERVRRNLADLEAEAARSDPEDRV